MDVLKLKLPMVPLQDITASTSKVRKPQQTPSHQSTLGPEVLLPHLFIGLLHRAKLDQNAELEKFCNTLESSVI
jgi:hypothetical protein